MYLQTNTSELILFSPIGFHAFLFQLRVEITDGAALLKTHVPAVSNFISCSKLLLFCRLHLHVLCPRVPTQVLTHNKSIFGLHCILLLLSCLLQQAEEGISETILLIFELFPSLLG